jgi:hypothetical protein
LRGIMPRMNAFQSDMSLEAEAITAAFALNARFDAD